MAFLAVASAAIPSAYIYVGQKMNRRSFSSTTPSSQEGRKSKSNLNKFIIFKLNLFLIP